MDQSESTTITAAARTPSPKETAASAANPYASASAGDPGRATTYTSTATARQIAASIPPRKSGKSYVSSWDTLGYSTRGHINTPGAGTEPTAPVEGSTEENG